MTSSFWLHPALVLIAGALLLPFIPKKVKTIYLVIVPLLVLIRVIVLQFAGPGVFGILHTFGLDLVFGRVDKLSMIFAIIMGIMALLGTVYSLHVQENGHHIASWIYVAGSLGVIFAGDFVSLFLFWELMAFSSVFLIWQRRSKRSEGAGYRYLLVHIAGGLSLLAGILLRWKATGSLTFDHLDVLHPDLATYLIAAGFLLNAAVPPLHAWLPDAYAEASVAGSVFLCAFTTKTAVYALIRGVAGMELLLPLGVVMAIYGVVFAVLENDSRKLLAYHIISQVGYMVAAVGLGTELAVNGACAHAFAHILYKGLLFMGTGAVLHMTGESRFSALGGLYRKMPLAFLFTLIGGLSISAFPLFSGFVSKSIIVAASFEDHRVWAGMLLLLASAGTFLHTGLKVPYFIWFGKDRSSDEVKQRAKDAPWNMNLAMAITAVLCIAIGIFPGALYRLLPFAVEYHPYTGYHILETLQILLFTALGFFICLKMLEPHATISIDLDWFYRKGGRIFLWLAEKPAQWIDTAVNGAYRTLGFKSVLGAARAANTFDAAVIDSAVDGTAESVRSIGGAVRRLQPGHIQSGLLALALLLGAFLLILAFVIIR
ncbi:MAG: Na(+)/H(+) antiporter subunit D [Spirochaetes bacterium]|nr:Na(+)/H(+) antiporter subunit D [Spirochaetota bacterium]